MRRLDTTCGRVSSPAANNCLRVAITLVLIGLLSATSLAATRSWDGGGGANTDWTTNANWSSNIEPGASDTAVFDRGAAFNYTVTFPFLAPLGGDITTDRLIVGSNTVTFEPDHSTTNYLVTEPTTIEADPILGFPVRGITIGAEANDTAAVLVSHLGLLEAVAATLGHATGSSGTLTLNQNNDQFNVTGGFSGPDAVLIIGRYGTGVVNVSGGADVNVINNSSTSGYVMLGEYAGSNGTVNVSNANSIWTSSGDLSVGYSGTGTLNVSDGAHVSIHNQGSGAYSGESASLGVSASAQGTANISGSGSIFDINGPITIGEGGTGTINVTNGGTLNSGAINYGGEGPPESSYVGYASGSIGTVSVDGDGSTWSYFGDLYVGYEGQATVDLRNRGIIGTIENVFGPEFNVFIGFAADSTAAVNVDGTGSSMTSLNALYVGHGGSGSVGVTNGGQVNSIGATIGHEPAATGEVTVDGMGSSWTSGELRVGDKGNGTLNITAAGNVATSVGYIGQGSGSTGKVTVDGTDSTWTTSGNLYVGFDGNGTLTVTNDGTVGATNVIVGALGSIHGDGNIVGVVQNSGLVSPGISPGALHIDGDYTQTPNGELLIEMAESSYDQLQVTDNATVDGTLTVSFLDGFLPSVGQTYAIITADDVDGTFATKMLPSVPNLGFDVIYNAQSVVLTVFSALAGDYNGDGTVDAADYVVWRKNVGAATLNNRDPNGMGPVGPADYDFWRMHFGDTVGSGAGAAASANVAVPEPTSLVLLIITVTVGIARCRCTWGGHCCTAYASRRRRCGWR